MLLTMPDAILIQVQCDDTCVSQEGQEWNNKLSTVPNGRCVNGPRLIWTESTRARLALA